MHYNSVAKWLGREKNTTTTYNNNALKNLQKNRQISLSNINSVFANIKPTIELIVVRFHYQYNRRVREYYNYTC